MARIFKRKDRLNAMSEINITSLLDLVFCLLIIFMITASVIEQNIPVKLPSQPQGASPARDPKAKYVNITINAQGELFYEKDPVSPDALRAQLKQLAAQPDPPTINVRSDLNLHVQQMIDVLTMISQAGLTKLNIPTQVR